MIFSNFSNSPALYGYSNGLEIWTDHRPISVHRISIDCEWVAGDLNGRRGLRVASWWRCNKFGAPFAGVGSLTRGVDAGKRRRAGERRRGQRRRRRGSVVRGCPSERHTRRRDAIVEGRMNMYTIAVYRCYLASEWNLVSMNDQSRRCFVLFRSFVSLLLFVLISVIIICNRAGETLFRNAFLHLVPSIPSYGGRWPCWTEGWSEGNRWCCTSGGQTLKAGA